MRGHALNVPLMERVAASAFGVARWQAVRPEQSDLCVRWHHLCDILEREPRRLRCLLCGVSVTASVQLPIDRFRVEQAIFS